MNTARACTTTTPTTALRTKRTLRLPARPRGASGREARPALSFPVAGMSLIELEKALAERRVTLLLQPQIDLATGSTSGVETLARIVGPGGELIGPAEFVPLAERSGLIRPLGRELFRLACEAARELAAAGHPDLRVAINLSVVQISDPEEVGILLAILAASGATPSQLEIELTESAAIQNFAVVHDQLQRFRALGLSVAIDDFGTGFCSLTYLLELDVDRLKIDRLFIQAIDRGDRSNLADTVITLGKKLSLDVVAEGVETESEARWLRRHHCPAAQGFLFSRPVPLAELLASLPAGPAHDAAPAH